MEERFAHSRRLLGPNRHFTGPGAVLDALAPEGFDPEAIERWRGHALGIARQLGWDTPILSAHRHRTATTLALSAPVDQLQTACDVNEISWAAAASGTEPELGDLAAASAAEREPALTTLIGCAAKHGLPVFLDDDEVTIGIGAGGKTWPRDALPAPADVGWGELSDAPVLVVTGTNGKTTTVRICARIAEEAGHVAGYNCTEDVVVGGQVVATGDYAGPAGSRRVLRHPRTRFAVLETARGGILRRGLAVNRAKTAIVTNIGADHFGEFGVETIEDLAEVKLTVAKVLGPDGMLVVNGEIPLLLDGARVTGCRLGLFGLDYDAPALSGHRAQGGATCGVRAGRLVLAGEDLGAIDAMPLTVGGSARYNIANMAAAALGCSACGIGPAQIRAALASFGSQRSDNRGRLERWRIRGVEALLDYAHNPDGMGGLLAVANSLRGSGRLGLCIGQAGNRSDGDIRDLARTAAAARPDLIIVKDEAATYLRGRGPGEVPELLRHALLDAGIAADRVQIVVDELEAAYTLLAWAERGDVAVLSVHGAESRPRLRSALDMIEARNEARSLSP